MDDLRNPGVGDTTQKPGCRRYGWGGVGNASEEAGWVGGSAEEVTNSWDAAEETASGGCGDCVGNASKKAGRVGEAAESASGQSSSNGIGRQSSTDDGQGTESVSGQSTAYDREGAKRISRDRKRSKSVCGKAAGENVTHTRDSTENVGWKSASNAFKSACGQTVREVTNCGQSSSEVTNCRKTTGEITDGGQTISEVADSR